MDKPAAVFVIGLPGIVIDGIFRSNKQRQQIFDIVNKHNVNVPGYQLICPEDNLLQRIRLRKSKGTVSPTGEKRTEKSPGNLNRSTTGLFV